MEVRQMATAFLINQDKVLMMNIEKLKRKRDLLSVILENSNIDNILVGTVTVNNELNPQIQWATTKETVTF